MMSKFKDFLNKIKEKVKTIKPYQLIGVIIIIALVIWYIVSLFGPNKPKPPKPHGPLCNTSGNDQTITCNVGQQCQTQCNPPQCSENGKPGEKYYCDLRKWDIDCGNNYYPYLNTACGKTSETDKVRCISNPPNGSLTTTGKEYQSLISQNGNDCAWLTGFEKDNCKLTNTDDSTGILYGDCIDNLNGNPYSFNNNIINDSKGSPLFKCGYPQDTKTSSPNKWIPQGQDGLLAKSSEIINADIFSGCSNPKVSSKSGFASIISTDWNDIGTKNSNKKLLSSDGTTTSTSQNLNDICGVHISNDIIDGYMQTIDCSDGGKKENSAWENYYTSLNCSKDGMSISSNKCDVPCWMFKQENSKANGQGSNCDGTNSCNISGGFDTQCLWNQNSCNSAEFTFTKIAQSCNYDSDGCSTKLDSSGTIITSNLVNGNCEYSTTDIYKPDPNINGCRPKTSLYNFNGSECIMGILTSNCINSINFDIDYKGTSISIKSIDLTLLNKDQNFMNELKKALDDKSTITFNILIYGLLNNKIDMTNQIYTINNDNNLIIDYNQDISNISFHGTGSDNLIYFPSNSSSNLKTFNDAKAGKYFMGLSIKIGQNLIMNSVEYSQNLNNIDLSNSKNIFIK